MQLLDSNNSITPKKESSCSSRLHNFYSYHCRWDSVLFCIKIQYYSFIIIFFSIALFLLSIHNSLVVHIKDTYLHSFFSFHSINVPAGSTFYSFAFTWYTDSVIWTSFICMPSIAVSLHGFRMFLKHFAYFSSRNFVPSPLVHNIVTPQTPTPLKNALAALHRHVSVQSMVCYFYIHFSSIHMMFKFTCI